MKNNSLIMLIPPLNYGSFRSDIPRLPHLKNIIGGGQAVCSRTDKNVCTTKNKWKKQLINE